MSLLIPPKDIVRSIQLTDTENDRFLATVEAMGHRRLIEQFIQSTGMYLRGRSDGTTGSGTKACGYIFLDQRSYNNCHRRIAFFDPFPASGLLKLSFRRWNRKLPFSEDIWNNRLDAVDELQPKMRVKYIRSGTANDLTEAIELALMVRETFSTKFDLSICRCTA